MGMDGESSADNALVGDHSSGAGQRARDMPMTLALAAAEGVGERRCLGDEVPPGAQVATRLTIARLSFRAPAQRLAERSSSVMRGLAR